VIMLFATMQNARKSGVTEKTRQQSKARPPKTKDVVATFKQHCSSLQSTVGTLKQEEGLEYFRRCISDGAAPVKKEPGFEQYRRSLSGPCENKATFKEYRRSLSISRISDEGSKDVNTNGEPSSEDYLTMFDELMQERCASECTEQAIQFDTCKSDLFDTCKSYLSQASTAVGTCEEEEDDEGDFSQACTTVGDFADEGPFDISLR